MGATSRVTFGGFDPARRRDLGHNRRRGRLARLEHADDRVGRLAVPDHVVDGLGAGRRPHRAGTHREELSVLQGPAGVLAGQAGMHRMIGDDLNHRGCPASDLARHDRHLRQVAQADPSQLDPRDQAPSCLDPAVDVSAAPFDRVHGDSAFLFVRQERFDHPESTSVQRHRHLNSLIANGSLPVYFAVASHRN